MADAIEALEKDLAAAIEDKAMLDLVFATLDRWRMTYGGSEHYIGKKSQSRRLDTMRQLAEQGVPPAEIAKRVGVSTRQVYRRVSRKSSYMTD